MRPQFVIARNGNIVLAAVSVARTRLRPPHQLRGRNDGSSETGYAGERSKDSRAIASPSCAN